MGNEGVKASRDGDRFHYYWAARRALLLLDPVGDLKALTIEGLGDATPDELEGARDLQYAGLLDGEEVVDVAEFYGGETFETCERYECVQLKHSTVRTDKPVVASEIASTLAKFASLYRKHVGTENTCEVSFVLIMNRRLQDKVRDALIQVREGTSDPTHNSAAKLIRRALGFGEDRTSEVEFLSRLRVEDGVPGLAQMQTLLDADLAQFLPRSGVGNELLMLMEAVSTRATTMAPSSSLARRDVLLALRTTEQQMFPAPNRVEELEDPIVTEDVTKVLDELETRPTNNNKLVLTALGGAGKSILTTLLTRELTARGSEAVVFDCFAGGDYKQGSSHRHGHRAGLTQIANDLASRGMCPPLVPTEATDSAYTTVFMSRIESASARLASERPDALLVIVVDAADNAAMIADSTRSTTFVRDLLQERWPANARLIELCRPERRDLLGAPLNGVTHLKLSGFSKAESTQHLRRRFPEATDQDGWELHELSAGSPRVQAMAMQSGGLRETLTTLRIVHGVGGDTLDELFSQQVNQIADEGHLSAEDLEGLGRALAVLPPPIPVADLAQVTGLKADAIRSFATALGRGLHLNNDDLQFRDEPTETWFANEYRPGSADRRAFVERFSANTSSTYAEMTMPQLLFEAGMYDEIVELVTTTASTPASMPASTQPASPTRSGIEDAAARDTARARARYAVAAMLRVGRFVDAALLAVTAGSLSAGHSRTMNLYRKHSDLASAFLDPPVVAALCSGRDLAEDWPGSSLHTEAALLSGVPAFRDLARGRADSAFENFVAISNLPKEQWRHFGARVGESEGADLAMADVNVNGPVSASRLVARWRSASFRIAIAQRLAARLADAGRLAELDELISSGKRVGPIRVGVAAAMFDYNIAPSKKATRRLVSTLARRRKPYKSSERVGRSNDDVRGVIWAIAHGLRHRLVSATDALTVLDRHLPTKLPAHIGSEYFNHPPTSLLLGFALRAHLRGEELALAAIVDDNVRDELGRAYISDERIKNLKYNIEPLLPWLTCWTETLVSPQRHATAAVSDRADGTTNEATGGAADEALEGAAEVFAGLLAGLKPVHERSNVAFVSVAAEIGVRLSATYPEGDNVAAFRAWYDSTPRSTNRSHRLIMGISMRSGVPTLEELGLNAVARAVQDARAFRTDSEGRIETLIGLARTVWSVSRDEADAIFNLAVAEADRVGDDLYARWSSLETAAASIATGDDAARAYRLFQIGEELEQTEGYVYVEKLAGLLQGLNGPMYLACTSRARDRRTLDMSQMITPAFRAAGPSHLDATSLLSLYALNPNESWAAAVAGLSTDDHATAHTVFSQFNRHVRAPLPETQGQSRNWDISVRGAGGEEPLVIETEFANVNFTVGSTWTGALEQIGWRPEARVDLIQFAFAQHPTSRPAVVRAFAGSPAAEEADFAQVAEAVASLPVTPALASELSALGSTYAKRFATRIATRQHETDDVARVARAAGTGPTDLLAEAFIEVGAQAQGLEYADYFHLAARISTTLVVDDARRIFDALAGLFDDLAHPASGADGGFADQPPLPESLDTCLAALLWGSLGDIDIQMRWRAAHAVTLLAQLGCVDAMTALAAIAQQAAPYSPNGETPCGGDGRPGTSASGVVMDGFLDSRLPFYDLHATWWLLMALDRVSLDDRSRALDPFVPWLIRLIHGRPHAVNQLLAQETLARIYKCSDGSPATGTETAEQIERALAVHLSPRLVERVDRDTIRELNPLAQPGSLKSSGHPSPPFAAVDDDGSAGADDDEYEEKDDASGEGPERRLRFFYDFERYWCDDLAGTFGSTPADVARHARRVAPRISGYELLNEPGDPRSGHSVYSSYKRSHPDHGSWGEEDNLGFYVGLHALFVLGAELALAHPAVKFPDDSTDEYARWLEQYLPKRRDGRWLADRRDAPPTPVPDKAASKVAIDPAAVEMWRWSLTPAHFEAAVGIGSDWVTVWAFVDSSHQNLDDDVLFQSALVANESARSALIALQTSRFGIHARSFPTIGGHDHYDEDAQDACKPYALTPWLDEHRWHYGIDEHDERSGGVSFPPVAPSARLIEQFGLTCDSDRREWRQGSTVVARSRLWNNKTSGSANRENGSRGELFQVRQKFLTEMLAALDKTLLVKAGLRRDQHHSEYERRKDKSDEFDSTDYSGKFYLLNPQGRWIEY